MIRNTAWVGAVVLGLTGTARAQLVEDYRFKGSVVDQDAKPVGGVQITLRNVESGARIVWASNPDGSFDRRMIPGETFDQAEAEIREVVERVRARDSESWSFELRRTLAIPPLEVAPDERIVRECQRAYREVTGEESRIGCTSGFVDAHWLARAGIPTAMYGPYVYKRWEGEDRFYAATGKPDEQVSIAQWLTAIRVYMRLALNLLA